MKTRLIANRLFITRRTFVAALAILSAALGPASEKVLDLKRRGYRHGKHNGQNPGAFGGGKAAKNHRKLYVASLA